MDVIGDPPVVKVRLVGDRGRATVALGFSDERKMLGFVIEPPAHGIRNLVIGSPFDAIGELADFYAGLLGMRVIREDWLTIARDRRTMPYVAFGDGWSDTRPVRWPDPAFPQHLHLDVAVDDLDDAEGAVLAAGATRLQDAGSYRSYADPVGHPFCLTIEHADGRDRDIARIVFDGPDPSALADFYGELLAMPERVEQTPDRIVIARRDGTAGPMFAFQRSDSLRPVYPDPDRAAMAHLDLYFDEGAKATALALTLGAEPLHRPGMPDDAPPTVFADPAGHPFCLVSPHHA